MRRAIGFGPQHVRQITNARAKSDAANHRMTDRSRALESSSLRVPARLSIATAVVPTTMLGQNLRETKALEHINQILLINE